VLSTSTGSFSTLDSRGTFGITTLDEAEAARDRATCRLRDAEHWRRLVEARLDLAVAAVADIDDLETTLACRVPTGASRSRRC
jgi:hypothetical protein